MNHKCGLKTVENRLLVENPLTGKCIYDDGTTAQKLKKQGYKLRIWSNVAQPLKFERKDVFIPLQGIVKVYEPVEKASANLEDQFPQKDLDLIEKVRTEVDEESIKTTKKILKNPNDPVYVEQVISDGLKKIYTYVAILVSTFGIAKFIYDDWYNKIFHFVRTWWIETSKMSWKNSVRTGFEAAATQAVATQFDLLPEMMIALVPVVMASATLAPAAPLLTSSAALIKIIEKSNSATIINIKNWFSSTASFKLVKAVQSIDEFAKTAAESIAIYTQQVLNNPTPWLDRPLIASETPKFGIAAPILTTRDVLRGLLPFGDYLFPGQIQYNLPVKIRRNSI